LLIGGCMAETGSAPVATQPSRGSQAVEPVPPPIGVCQDSAGTDITELLTTDLLFLEATADDPVDAETTEDNQLLTDGDQSVPANEGDTVPAATVAFDVPVVENAKVQYFLDYYSGPGKKVFARWLERSERYLPMMRAIFAEEGMPEDLAYLAMVESGFNPKAYSWANAVGPWQFIESTGKIMGLEINWWFDERRDFEKSTRAAARFLGDLNRRFDGDWYLTIAAYNAGPGKINNAIHKYGTRDFWELTRGNYLQAETKNYVPKYLAALQIAKQPEKYGLSDLDYREPVPYETAIIATTTDLEVVADLCGVDYEQVKELNPELKRWCTPPHLSDYRIRIPAGTGERFRDGYEELPPSERANYQRHKIRKGDTLLALAQKYRIRVKDIIDLNRIANPRALQLGQELILPLKKGYTDRPITELRDDYNRTRLRTYTVRSGDSIWKIACRFGVTEKQLRVWNRLGWSNVIRPGQKLQVSASGTYPKPRAKSKRTAQKIVYQVKAGDTLWDIARKYEVATKNIMDWNNLSDDHVLRPGDKLTLLVGS